MKAPSPIEERNSDLTESQVPAVTVSTDVSQEDTASKTQEETSALENTPDAPHDSPQSAGDSFAQHKPRTSVVNADTVGPLHEMDHASDRASEITRDVSPAEETPSKGSFFEEKEVVAGNKPIKPEPEEKQVYDLSHGGYLQQTMTATVPPMQATSGPLQDFYVDDLEH